MRKKMPTTSPSRLPWSPLKNPPRWIHLSLEPSTELDYPLLLSPPSSIPLSLSTSQNSLNFENHKGAVFDDKQHANTELAWHLTALVQKVVEGGQLSLLCVMRTRRRRGQGAPSKEWICIWQKWRICFKLYVYFSCLHQSHRFSIFCSSCKAFVVFFGILFFYFALWFVLFVCMYVCIAHQLQMLCSYVENSLKITIIRPFPFEGSPAGRSEGYKQVQ